MICQYNSTFADFKAAQELHRKHSRSAAITYYTWFWLLPAIGLITLVVLIVGNTGHHFAIVDHFGAGMAGFAWCTLYQAAYRPLWLKKCYKRVKSGRPEGSPIEFEVTEQEIISRLPGKSEGRFLPSSIVDYVEDERVALIYVAKKLFLFIPKRAMNETEWSHVRAWIRTNTGGKA